MADFKVSTEELRSTSTELNQKVGMLESEINAMTSRIQSMRGMWQGDASNRFEDKWLDWQRASTQVKEALEGVAKFLGSAAQTYEDAEHANTAGS